MELKNKIFYLVVIVVILVIQIGISVSALDDLFALQGNIKQSGANLASGDIRVHIYDAISAGNLIYIPLLGCST